MQQNKAFLENSPKIEIMKIRNTNSTEYFYLTLSLKFYIKTEITFDIKLSIKR